MSAFKIAKIVYYYFHCLLIKFKFRSSVCDLDYRSSLRNQIIVYIFSNLELFFAHRKRHSWCRHNLVVIGFLSLSHLSEYSIVSTSTHTTHRFCRAELHVTLFLLYLHYRRGKKEKVKFSMWTTVVIFIFISTILWYIVKKEKYLPVNARKALS